MTEEYRARCDAEGDFVVAVLLVVAEAGKIVDVAVVYIHFVSLNSTSNLNHGCFRWEWE